MRRHGQDSRVTLSCHLPLTSVRCTQQANIQTLLFVASGHVLSPRRGEPASKRVSRRCLRVVITTPQKQPKTYLIRATTQDVQDKAHLNRKHSLLPLGPCRASLMWALKLIFDGQAVSLILSIGNFGFAPYKREKFGWVPSHEALPAGAARRM